MLRDACDHALRSCVQHGGHKPRFYGYTTHHEAEAAWAFYLETRIIPYSPAQGGVSSTPIPRAQPTTPQRYRHSNVQGSAGTGASASPSSPYNSAVLAHPTSPNMARVASSPLRSTPLPPLYSQLPPSQSRTFTVARRAEELIFFVVTVGYNPGVFATR